ncbi:MAG: GTP-binding protein [Thermaceae bacterium]|nr:GTP-binding protein [Thermaceae bacterium]
MIQKKICMLGAFAVGKTSLVARYVHSIFSERYHTTVGVKIDKKELILDKQPLSLVLWDLYGEDGFSRVQPFYLRGSSGYLLVADGTRPDTLDTAIAMQARTQEVLGGVPFVLLINKSDLEGQLEEGQLEALRARGWTILQTSAKTGQGVEEAFGLLAKRMLAE